MAIERYKKHLLTKGSRIKDALACFNILAQDAILFIIDEDERLLGALTDGDVRRGLLKGYTIENIVDEIIQPNPKFIRYGDNDISKIIEFRNAFFRILPVLDKENHIINIINFREIKSYLPVDAVIMAGGRGERLRPMTDSTPKSMLMVSNKPIIEHNINHLSLFGIENLYISVHYLGEQIIDYFGDGTNWNVKIQYTREEKPLGTIGSITSIDCFKHEYILVINADILTDIDLESFFIDFLKKNADLSAVTIPYQVNIPYAVFETIDGRVLSLKEKPNYTYFSNGGIYLMKRSALDFIPSNSFYNTTDLMERLIQEGMNVISYPLFSYWLDIGRNEDYYKANLDFEKLNLKFK